MIVSKIEKDDYHLEIEDLQDLLASRFILSGADVSYHIKKYKKEELVVKRKQVCEMELIQLKKVTSTIKNKSLQLKGQSSKGVMSHIIHAPIRIRFTKELKKIDLELIQKLKPKKKFYMAFDVNSLVIGYVTHNSFKQLYSLFFNSQNGDHVDQVVKLYKKWNNNSLEKILMAPPIFLNELKLLTQDQWNPLDTDPSIGWKKQCESQYFKEELLKNYYTHRDLFVTNTKEIFECLEQDNLSILYFSEKIKDQLFEKISMLKIPVHFLPFDLDIINEGLLGKKHFNIL